jgi:hypothetical protein
MAVFCAQQKTFDGLFPFARFPKVSNSSLSLMGIDLKN